MLNGLAPLRFVRRTMLGKLSDNERERDENKNNMTKTEKLKGIFSPLKFASSQLIEKQVGASVGSLGPQNLDIYKIADLGVEGLCNFVCGANETGKHFINMNWSDNCSYDEVADIR